jgi:type IV pilus assembly protein PilA
MKTEFKTKFLQYLNQRNKEEKGFTLIELLVVIIIIGILSAIALPSFLSQANKAKQSEAKQYIGSMNRTQQAKYAELNSFVNAVDGLGMGIKTQTTNYTYAITLATTNDLVTNFATPVAAALKGYAGNVALVTPAGQTDSTTVAVLCEVDNAGNTAPAVGSIASNSVTCASGQSLVQK